MSEVTPSDAANKAARALAWLSLPMTALALGWAVYYGATGQVLDATVLTLIGAFWLGARHFRSRIASILPPEEPVDDMEELDRRGW